jgi:electron transport complex protein RnfD
VVIIVAGLYLIYRNYVKWQLPLAFVVSAAAVVAVAPINLDVAGHVQVTWWPLLIEELDVGFTYLNYQLLSGELLLAALFLAPETTSRPVTTAGQVLFGTGCGVIAMLLRLYLNVPVPCYMAILVMNTVTPRIDKLWRPRVFGTKRFGFLRFLKIRFRKT